MLQSFQDITKLLVKNTGSEQAESTSTVNTCNGYKRNHATREGNDRNTFDTIYIAGLLEGPCHSTATKLAHYIYVSDI